MGKVKKILAPGAVLALAVAVLWLCDARDAMAAAPYKRIFTEGDVQKERTVGGTVFEKKGDSLYAVRNGTKQLVMKKKNLHYEILTNGEVVYASTGDPKKKKVTVYVVSSSGEKEKELFSCRAYEGNRFCLEGYYAGKLCYIRSMAEMEEYELWEYTEGTGKVEAVTKEDVGSVTGYGAYLYITPNTGAYDAMQSLRVYDIEKGKLKTVCRHNAMFDVRYGSLYYLETLKVKRHIITVSVKKCNLDGGKKKTLIKKMVMEEGLVKFNKKSIIYTDEKGKKKSKKYEY